MAEWPNASVLKTEVPARGPWVRILHPPLMFLEVLDYWITKLTPAPLGLGVIKWPEKYIRVTEKPWKYAWTTLDFAYLEIRQVKVKIEQADPFYVYGDFGGKFAIYGDAVLEEHRITEITNRLQTGNHWLSGWIIGGKLRRLKQHERKAQWRN